MKYHVLGPLELMTDDGPVPVRGRRIRALLAILLMHSGQVVPIDRVVDDIWLDDPPRSAIENVRTYVYQLRLLLGHGQDENVLESHPGGYRLIVDPDELDVTRFDQLSTEGRQANRLGRPDTAVVLLGEALGLWRGEPLSGIDLSQAMRAKTVALKEQWWQTKLEWISARLACGESGELVVPLRELLGECPLDENLWRLLITALALDGRTGEALAVFGEARRTFVDELGIEPGPELRRLQTRVLRGDEALTPPRRGPVVRPFDAVKPHQLPPEVPDFVGRADALHELCALAERSAAGDVDHVPTALISGPPGIGKTATAVAAAGRVRACLPDGEVYVDLGGLSGDPQDPEEVLAALIRSSGVAQDAVPDAAEERRSLYRSVLADRRMLILLDNATDSGQVLPLIPGPSRNLVVVASRRRLTGVRADLRLMLEPMSDGEALEMLGRAIGSDRVMGEPEASRRIVAACGRLPCAVGIVGARLSTRPNHPLGVLADRLASPDRVLDELTFDGVSVRATFESSYRALDVPARHCFRALGRLPADRITAADVGRAIGMPTHLADRELEGLVSEGLLGAGGTVDGTPTFRMLTVLHAYARERLDRAARDRRPESA